MINEREIKGEPNTGFEKRKLLGPFECGNCRYYSHQECSQEDMRKHSKQPKLPNGNVRVAPGDCCEYVDRHG